MVQRLGDLLFEHQKSEELFKPLTKALAAIYPDWDGVKQLEGTERRLYKMFQELCWTQDTIDKELDKHTRLFKDKYEEEITVTGINVVSLCPHHLLPCRFSVDISCSPLINVLGLSKFARIAVILGKRPIMQETYTRDLAECLMQRLEPKTVKVEVRGVHGCLSYRGALQPDVVVTTTTSLPR